MHFDSAETGKDRPLSAALLRYMVTSAILLLGYPPTDATQIMSHFSGVPHKMNSLKIVGIWILLYLPESHQYVVGASQRCDDAYQDTDANRVNVSHYRRVYLGNLTRQS